MWLLLRRRTHLIISRWRSVAGWQKVRLTLDRHYKISSLASTSKILYYHLNLVNVFNNLTTGCDKYHTKVMCINYQTQQYFISTDSTVLWNVWKFILLSVSNAFHLVLNTCFFFTMGQTSTLIQTTTCDTLSTTSDDSCYKPII